MSAINFEQVYATIAAGLESRGVPSGWIQKTVDKSDPAAYFLKQGKPHYASECPHFEGYWLRGGCGSVQCALSKSLFPGIHWDIACRKNHQNCPHFLSSQEVLL